MGVCIFAAVVANQTNCCKGNSEWTKLEEKKMDQMSINMCI